MIEIRHPGMDNTRAVKSIYDQLHEDASLDLHDSFYLWLISLLKPQSGKRLLDISCGSGRLITLARQYNLTCVGMDFSERGVRSGKAGCSQAGWTVADGQKMPVASNSFDYITHIGSLEHYLDPAAGIQEIARILKHDGTALVLLPNAYGLFGNIKHVWRKGDVFDDGQPLQRYNTRMGWQKLLLQNGLVTSKVKKYEFERPRTRRDLWYTITHPFKLVRIIISIFIPVNLANCIVYVCHRRAD